MSYHAEVLADSISPAGHRLTTMLWTFPRFILAEVNTHKLISKCSASSREIPVEKRIKAVRENPFAPDAFGKNRRGMQATENLEDEQAEEARKDWMLATEDAIFRAEKLATRGVHKQHANRLLELYSWHTAILSGTDWDNLFALRCHPDAQPEFRKIAELARDVRRASQPQELKEGEWHLPFIDRKYGDDDFMDCYGKWDLTGSLCSEMLGFHPSMISAARCARVSYLTHDGTRNRDQDVILYDRLTKSGHMSPLEHPARPMTERELEQFETWVIETDPDQLAQGYEFKFIGSYLGNFNGWVQLRKTVPGERVFGRAE